MLSSALSPSSNIFFVIMFKDIQKQLNHDVEFTRKSQIAQPGVWY